MKNSEEAIRKVLAGLRDIEAPAGMERRILDGLEERAAQTRVRSQWFGLGWCGASVSYVVCGVALGVVALALAVPAVRRFEHAPTQAKIGVAPVKPRPAASSGVAAVVPEPALRGQGVRPMEADARGTGLVRGAGPGVGSTADSEDSVAMSEMRAASFPAPPMPLTEQERLLLRMEHKNDPVELAMLDPKLWELSEVEEKEEFQRFFARPTVKQPSAEEQMQPEPTVTEQTAHGESTAEAPVNEQAAPTVDKVVPASTPNAEPQLE